MELHPRLIELKKINLDTIDLHQLRLDSQLAWQEYKKSMVDKSPLEPLLKKIHYTLIKKFSQRVGDWKQWYKDNNTKL